MKKEICKKSEERRTLPSKYTQLKHNYLFTISVWIREKQWILVPSWILSLFFSIFLSLSLSFIILKYSLDLGFLSFSSYLSLLPFLLLLPAKNHLCCPFGFAGGSDALTIWLVVVWQWSWRSLRLWWRRWWDIFLVLLDMML